MLLSYKVYNTICYFSSEILEIYPCTQSTPLLKVTERRGGINSERVKAEQPVKVIG